VYVFGFDFGVFGGLVAVFLADEDHCADQEDYVCDCFDQVVGEE